MVSKSFSLKISSKILPFNKTLKVDSDKSLSIRSIIIGSISQGISVVKNILESDDVKDTILTCRKLGVKISKEKNGNYKIFGKGLGSFFVKKNSNLYFGNSGTASRLLLGVLSTNPNIEVNVAGDKSLNKRSMEKLINILTKFGAIFLPKNKNNFPLKLISSNMPVGIKYNSGVSAQLKSAVIFAGLNSNGVTVVKELVNSRNHTENLLIQNTQTIKIIKKQKKIIINGKKFLKPINITIGGDPSSAAFFVALAILNKNSSIKIKNVGLNPTRIGFYEILKKHNAKINFINVRKKNNEIIGDILAKSSKLKPILSPPDLYSRTTDEFLILFVIAALTKGVSKFNNISELQNKESSRAHEMKKILNQIGVKCNLTNNTMRIFGKGMVDLKQKKILVPSLRDHRVAMCGVVLAALTNSQTTIKGFETVFSSFPSFLKLFKFLGGKYEIKK